MINYMVIRVGVYALIHLMIEKSETTAVFCASAIWGNVRNFAS